ncbi:Stk1 family PASTA domain-containing Ser/Thr kinase [Thermotalea metallivorans]|uniref:non-specific serine/threonine protein kinase n=1 Tax=Thermotalea metallivorans TaxID=520762 RepID=A0A140L614_9FIRM|nr:Stk1 family PASTA domain-containing Ser/Thr kinase [Thermotalea metallivorans]KXG75989.1 Serine/threonine-protein kinase PrkC [Thermotalea metallivorans]
MIGKILGNRYEIIEKIGGGGMALVYKARCQLLNRYVAVKILRPEFTSDEEFIGKFRRESQAAASLSHPNIVNIYDVGTDDHDIYYIVMEYVKGKTLKQMIKEKGPLSSEETINIAKQISLALHHAHSNHIVHRDIKPHNILITDDGRVKVTDFGIARAVTSSTVTNTGNVIGSVHYFSPEQARGGYIDEKSDIYSLGIVMYEMATGRLPFEGESPISIALKHIHEDVIPPTLINQEIPKALEDIIMKAIQKDQLKRYSSAKEILEDLNQALKQPMGNFVKFDEDDDSPTQMIPVIKEKEPLKNKTSYAELKPKRKNNHRWIVWGAVATAFVLALLFIGGMFYLKDIFIAQEKTVPSVIGKSYEEAKENLENLGLKVELGQEQYSSEFERGQVMFQDPKAGEIVKAGYPIRLIISKGPKMTEVPTLVNRMVNEIDFILENAKLKGGIVKYEYSTLPIGIVISQSPEAGKSVPENTEVNVVVSQGPETKLVLMPNLIGEKIEDAKKMLETLNLILGNVDYKSDERVEKGRVISQSIPAGTEVEEKRVVDLVVSKGPENVGQPSEEDELQMKPVSLMINFQRAQREEFVLRILKKQNGISTEIYKATHRKSKGSQSIVIEGRGRAVIEVYFDDIPVDTVKIDFETGSTYD